MPLYFQEIVVELGLPIEGHQRQVFERKKPLWGDGQLRQAGLPFPLRSRRVVSFGCRWACESWLVYFRDTGTYRCSPLPLRSAFLKYIDKERGRAQMRFRRALTQVGSSFARWLQRVFPNIPRTGGR